MQPHELSLPVPIQTVDRLEITVLMDNYVDVLLPGMRRGSISRRGMARWAGSRANSRCRNVVPDRGRPVTISGG